MQIEKTVFISYRRTNAMTARAVYQDLTQHGYDVFLDYNSIDSGAFSQIILNQIASRAHFVVILTPSALERCAEPNDWLRKEIEYALETKRNIVPLMFEGFDFKAVQQYLVEKLAVLPQYNALNIPADYFDEAMGRLRTRFLNKPLDVILHPTTAGDRAAAAKAQANEVARPNVLPEELTAEQWFERGLEKCRRGQPREAIQDLTHAADLEPDWPDIYFWRGRAYLALENEHEALKDFLWAVDLKPDMRLVNLVQSLIHSLRGNHQQALAEAEAGVRSNPQYIEAIYRRAYERHCLKDYAGAIADYSEAILINPQYANAYYNRGDIYEKTGKLKQANADYWQYINLGGEDAEEARKRIRENEAEMRKGK